MNQIKKITPNQNRMYTNSSKLKKESQKFEVLHDTLEQVTYFNLSKTIKQYLIINFFFTRDNVNTTEICERIKR